MNSTISYGTEVVDHAQRTRHRREIAFEDVRALPCPKCGVDGGERCRVPIANGHTRTMASLHQDRVDAGLDTRPWEVVPYEASDCKEGLPA